MYVYLPHLQAASWGLVVSLVVLTLVEGASLVFQGHATSPQGGLGAG